MQSASIRAARVSIIRKKDITRIYPYKVYNARKSGSGGCAMVYKITTM